MTRAQNHLRYLGERYIYGMKLARREAEGLYQNTILTIYGVAALCYRVLIITVILQVVAGSFMGIGFMVVGVLIILWIIVPLGKFIRYLFHSPGLRTVRLRAIGITTAALFIILGVLGLLPCPYYLRAPGQLKITDESGVFAGSEGYVTEVLATPGTWVHLDQPLVRLGNPEIDQQIRSLRAHLEETRARNTAALAADPRMTLAMERETSATIRSLAYWQALQSALVVRAPAEGIWTCSDAETLKGMLMLRGTSLGLVSRNNSLHFSAIVSQEEASHLVNASSARIEIRLRGLAGKVISAHRFELVPQAQERLPSAALGWGQGGDVQVKSDDKEGTTTAETYYLVNSYVDQDQDIPFVANRTGQIRFQLNGPPLLAQYYERLLKLLQKRYSL